MRTEVYSLRLEKVVRPLVHFHLPALLSPQPPPAAGTSRRAQSSTTANLHRPHSCCSVVIGKKWSEALAPDPAPASEALATLPLGAADLPAEFAAAVHEIVREDEYEGYVTAASRGGSSMAAPRRREEFQGPEEEDGYGDAGPPSLSSSGYAGEQGEQRHLQCQRRLPHRGGRPRPAPSPQR